MLRFHLLTVLKTVDRLINQLSAGPPNLVIGMDKIHYRQINICYSLDHPLTQNQAIFFFLSCAEQSKLIWSV